MEAERILNTLAGNYLSVQVINLPGNTISTVKSNERMTGIPDNASGAADVLLRQIADAVCSDADREDLLAFLNLSDLEARMNNRRTIVLDFRGTRIEWLRAGFVGSDRTEDGHLCHVLFCLESISREKRREQRLLYLSATDQMTGINNRTGGTAKISAQLEAGHGGMFCLLDVDNFKSINDIYGHGSGDKVLIAIAEAMCTTFRGNDVVMRLGGDEFAVYAPGVKTRAIAETCINRLMKNISEIRIREIGERTLTVSLGAIINAGETLRTFEELYRLSDKAMYFVKQSGGEGYHFYSEPELTEKSEDRRSLEHLIRSLRAAGAYSGAMMVQYRDFARFYEFLMNMRSRYHSTSYLIKITIGEEDGEEDEKLERYMAIMEGSITRHIRAVDISTRFGNRCFLVLIVGAGDDSLGLIIDRIFARFREECGEDAPHLDYVICQDDSEEAPSDRKSE